MSGPLSTPPLLRLTGPLAMPVLDDLAQAPAGIVLLFLPQHAKAHLETPDIAAVLPDLVSFCAARAGGSPVSGAIADAALETALSEDMSLPALLLLRDGAVRDAIPRMRDWHDYTARLSAFTASSPLPASPAP